ncbi:MAG: hypothetical protein ACI85F_000546 [Bacteroidia bacterium]|jgi:hypothetical protein
MKKPLLLTGLAVIFALMTTTLSAQIVFLVEEPVSLEGDYSFTYADTWGADMDTIQITEYVVLFDDGTDADSLACNSSVNSDDLNGKIAALYRGECEFGAKSLAAQDAGAVAVIIINNVPGGAVGMAGGSVGAGVTIPVVMISDEDGALFRPLIDSGELLVFLGNKTGLFEFDLGHYALDGVSSKSFATPHQFALDSTDFQVPVGTWVHNYGFSEQYNVSLTATIDHDGTEVYNESATVDTIPLGDSVFVALPIHGSDAYEAGFYTLEYTTSSGEVDGFPNDNDMTSSWWINEDLYSKSSMDPATGAAIGSGGLRPVDVPEYMWCTTMQSKNASAKEVHGITFAVTTGLEDSLTDLGIQIHFYGWDDPYDGTAQPTFDDLDELTSAFYDFEENLGSVFIPVNFDAPVTLDDDRKYLSCVEVFDETVFIVTDNTMDYRGNDAAYPDLFFPLRSGTEWFGGGFGSENVPAIITNFKNVVGVEEQEIEEVKITPYPNPAIENITIPLAGLTETPVSLQVFDMDGRMVYSGAVNMSGSMLTVDVSSMTGMNNFTITFEDGSTNTFKVAVAK